MGLDMYLSAEKYIGGWNHSDKAETKLFKQIAELVGTADLVTPESPSITIRTNVAYWRKANAVHSWIVRELADGVDECQSIYVSREDMQRLINDCKEALALYKAGELELAEAKMTPRSGFFFGSTEVDEYWAEDLKYTVKTLEPLLKLDGEFDFVYRASW